MQISVRWKQALLVLAALFCVQVASAASVPQNDPIAMLQGIAKNMIAGLKANKATLKSKPQIVYSLANRYVVPYADLSAMSRRVLPPKTWNSASASQKAQFQKDFTRLLVRTYASALTSYSDQVIQFYPIRGGYAGKSNVEVTSDITGSSGSPIRVTYRLLRSGSSWRLYDMSVEGVGLIDSFRSQFADILANGDMNELLTKLSQHNNGQG